MGSIKHNFLPHKYRARYCYSMLLILMMFLGGMIIYFLQELKHNIDNRSSPEHAFENLSAMQQDYSQWENCLHTLDTIEENLPTRFYLEKLKISAKQIIAHGKYNGDFSLLQRHFLGGWQFKKLQNSHFVLTLNCAANEIKH